MKTDIERAARIAAAASVVLREIEKEPSAVDKRQRLAEALVQLGEARRIVHAELMNRHDGKPPD